MKTIDIPEMASNSRNERTQVTNARIADAFKVAIERCPEHASALKQIKEREWVSRLYVETHASLKDRYRELAATHLDLQREQSSQKIRFAMVAEFVSIMTRRLEAPVRALEDVVHRVRRNDGQAVGTRDRVLLVEHLMGIERVVDDLAHVSEVMRESRDAGTAFRGIMAPARGTVVIESAAPTTTEVPVSIAVVREVA